MPSEKEIEAAAQRLRAMLDGDFRYKAYRGKAPDGAPEMRSDLDLVLSSPLAESTPKRMVLVPIEATREMLQAAIWSLDKAKEADGKIQVPRPYTPHQKHAIRWRAMVAARPQLTAGGDHGEG